MVNRVILIGNLGRDPEVRRLDNGAVVAKFPVATNENYKDKSGDWQTQTEWHDVVVWRNLAERAESTLKKGMSVYIEGKLTHRTWEDQDGKNRKTTEVVGSYFRIIDKREGRSGDGGSSGYFPSSNDEPSGYDSNVPTEVPNAVDDDLPF
ncbi:MAG: single-stranded DNA-binding protein [Saprospiraceae bacterium]|nr:single-stranded DNA-binding protein [Saprospiraceae bacterium]